MCPYCGSEGEITAFGGYLHFIAVKHSIDGNVRSGYIKLKGTENGAAVYECQSCGDEWLFMPPDFPSAGFYRKVNRGQ